MVGTGVSRLLRGRLSNSRLPSMSSSTKNFFGMMVSIASIVSALVALLSDGFCMSRIVLSNGFTWLSGVVVCIYVFCVGEDCLIKWTEFIGRGGGDHTLGQSTGTSRTHHISCYLGVPAL